MLPNKQAGWRDNPPRHVLIVAPAWIGDMVIAQSLLMRLRGDFPEARITVLVGAGLKELVQRMPEVDQVIEHSFAHRELKLFARCRFAENLRNYNFDWSIVVPNSYKSALIPYWAGIPRRTGYLGEGRWGVLNDRRKVDRSKPTTIAEQLSALATAPGVPNVTAPRPHLHADPQQGLRFLQARGMRSDRPILALCPGAEYGPAKRWPPEHFAAVATRKLAEGWSVLILGGPGDRECADAVQSLSCSGCQNLAGQTSLTEAIDLLALTTVAVTNDSGLMHIAAAVGTCVVALFGSTDPGKTPPLSSKATVVSLNMECRPCFGRNCRFGHLRCMRDIGPDKVLRAIADRTR